ncbi:hypothetical protein NP233_g93 [Leucocoprinus birnbaumii]|uniref:Helicase C-terminal domain-containing protein n=1 Tax=Leucocoprinus birnbaumii TaxID=56174 RepID=A0AAD5W5Z1_9AGAR|nr:hypothetical protein NP233_g93 [Leucocoprinus birnbaumii]
MFVLARRARERASGWVGDCGDIPFYVASATLPPDLLRDVQDVLNLQDEATELILYSNDRPDINLAVRTLVAPAKSYHDLDFLFPDGFTEDSPLPTKFLIFFDDTKETIDAVHHLWSRLPTQALKNRVYWFNSIMTPQLEVEILEAFRTGEIIGLCCTDAFGTGMDVPDINSLVNTGTLPKSVTRRFKANQLLPSLSSPLLCPPPSLLPPLPSLLLPLPLLSPPPPLLLLAAPSTPAITAPSISATAATVPSTSATTPCSTSATAVPSAPSTAVNATPLVASKLKPKTLSVARKPYLKPKIVEPGNLVDRYINPTADVKCRRDVPDQYFDNKNRLTIFYPNLGRAYSVIYVKPKFTRRAYVKELIDEVKATQEFKDLRRAIFSWPQDNAPKKLSRYTIASIGAQSFLSEPMINWIIKCAYARKLTGELGPSLIDLLLKHLPLDEPEDLDELKDELSATIGDPNLISPEFFLQSIGYVQPKKQAPKRKRKPVSTKSNPPPKRQHVVKSKTEETENVKPALESPQPSTSAIPLQPQSTSPLLLAPSSAS